MLPGPAASTRSDQVAVAVAVNVHVKVNDHDHVRHHPPLRATLSMYA
jgi:hypothetical protein